MQWAQLDVTGGTIATTPVQQQIYAPDTTLYRFMGSLAVDWTRQHGARLHDVERRPRRIFRASRIRVDSSTDPLNTLPQTEVNMIAGAGSQVNNCGGAALRSMGRLQLDERRSRRRLHVLVHQRVLQQPNQRQQRQLADAHRLVQVSVVLLAIAVADDDSTGEFGESG